MSEQPAPYGVKEDVAEAGQGAAKNDQFGIDQVRDMGDGTADGEAGVVNHAKGCCISVQGQLHDVRRCQPAIAGALQQADHRRRRGNSFKAAAVAAPADEAVLVDGGVPEFAGDSDVAVVERAVEDEPGSDTRSDLQEDQVVHRAVRTPGDLGQRPQIGIIIDKHRDPEPLAKGLEDVDSHPFGENGTLHDGSGSPIDGAGNSNACAQNRASRSALFLQEPVEEFRCGIQAFLCRVPGCERDGFLPQDAVVRPG